MALNYVFDVCSEVGGRPASLYDVIRTRAELLARAWGDRYMVMGSYEPPLSPNTFDLQGPPKSWSPVFDALRAVGVECYTGRWKSAGNARVVLVNGRAFGQQIVEYAGEGGKVKGPRVNSIKHQLWKSHGIDSTMMGVDFDAVLSWNAAVSLLLEKWLELPEFRTSQGVLQVHDWSAAALVVLANAARLNLATVYTTHATVLGRALAGVGRDVLSEAQRAGERRVDLHEAYNLKVEGKHLLEIAAAIEADVFSAASATVADEASYMLGKTPDAVAMDGLTAAAFKPLVRGAKTRSYAAAELHSFLESYFAPYYSFDASAQLLLFLAGRYEFRAKGMDLYISALGRLNNALKLEAKAARPITAFVFSPSNTTGPRPEVLHNYLLVGKIRDLVAKADGPRLASFPLSKLSSKVSSSTRQALEELLASFRTAGELPPLCTHELTYPNDAIEQACKVAGLDNRFDDPVKVIFYPAFLRPGDGLLDLAYPEVLAAMDVGVFPSRYEPFGHTPLESAVAGSLTLASDATGFGRFLQDSFRTLNNRGVRTIPLVGQSDEAVSNTIATQVRQIARLPARRLRTLKVDAQRLAANLAWNRVLKSHLAIYQMALKRHTWLAAPTKP